MPVCSDFGCQNMSGRHDKSAPSEDTPKISFHRYPLSKPDLLKKWLHNVGRRGFTPSHNSRVCSEHFLADCFKEDLYGKYVLTPTRRAQRYRYLKEDAVPTEFTHRQAAKPRSATVSRLRKRENTAEMRELLSPDEATGKLATPEMMKPSIKIGPSSAKKRKVAETATLASLGLHVEEEECTSLMVDIVESPVSKSSSFRDPEQLSTPVKYNCVYGTPRRTLKDHSYASYAGRETRSLGTQTDSWTVPTQKTPAEKSPVTSPKLYSQFSDSEVSEEETPTKSSDFAPLSESESASDTDKPESPNPCEMRKFIVFQSSLDELHKFCKDCGSPVTERSSFTTGSMVGYRVSCHSGHTYVWRSQPLVHKMPVGNLLIAAAILTTGNTYGKICAFANILQLQIFSKTIFNKIQKENLLHVIQDTWEKERVKVVNNLKMQGDALVLAGDARCDSPGHTAKYGSYTLMHADGDGKSGTKKIVSMKLLQVSEVKNSNHMEPEGLKRCLKEVSNDKLKVSILATDRHKMVNSIMNKDYKKIQHQFDTWHVAKGIVKKLAAKAKKKACVDLGPWIQSISNHLWWCCATCGGKEQLLREKWLSVLQHVTNRHRWSGNRKIHKCEHPPLTAAQKKATKWLKPKSAAFEALQAIVTNKSLLVAMGKLTKFCHTGELEIFHSMLLKFCPKRQHFHYDVMSARLMMAAYDWNNTTMVQKQDKSGQPATTVVYSKRRKMFVLKKRYTKVKSNHMFLLLKRIFEIHESGLKLPPFRRPAELPKNVAKVPKPAKSELALKFRSRFK